MSRQPWREKKRLAQRIVHDTMGIYVDVYRQVDGTAELVVSGIRVRLHNQFGLIGDDRSMGWAEMNQIRPRAIFYKSEKYEPQRNDILRIDGTEAYSIDNTLPAEDVRLVAEITRLTKAQMESRLPK